MLGSAIAYKQFGIFDWSIFWMVMLGAVCAQIGTNNINDYPKDVDELIAEGEKYKEMYDYIIKGKKATSYVDFELLLGNLYEKDKRVAISKLMQVKFWYDALKYNENQRDKAELWTDILYLGMKVSAKGQFAPHAKIS